jgi:hypothetical protein
MRTISASVDIAVSPQEVWAVLADLESYGEWNPFIRSASGQLTEGTTLTLRMVPSEGRAITFRPRVLVAKPGVMLRWIGRLIIPGIFDGTHEFAPVLDPARTVQTDVNRVLWAAEIPENVRVSGHVYDVNTGIVTTVVDAKSRK